MNPWYLDNLTVSNNRIDGYGRGIQLETNSNPVIKSNNISNIWYTGIQAANNQTNAVIRGNTIDRAQLAAAYAKLAWPDGGVDWCTGAIRVWTVSTSSGFVVENNLITHRQFQVAAE
jgi:parallel beta-helix repeat protein